MTTIKITELTNIGANLNGNTLVPVVNMNGTPVTQRSNVENLANYVLNTGTGANLGAVGNITITGGTDGYVLQTDGAGNLSWVAQTGGGNGTPGGANTQIQFNDAGSFGGDSGLTFNKTTNDLTVAGNIVSTDGNVTANWVIGDYVSGNATPLHHIPGANVTGAVSFATTANAVAAANVSGLGNVALVNFDGNSSNVLYGNGVFDSIPNPFNQDLNTTDNVTFANITSTDAIRFSNSSNIVGAMGYAPNYVSIEGYGSNSVQITTNDLLTWSFNSEGILTFPEGTTTTGSSIETPAGDDFSITTSSITSVSAPCAIAVGDEFVADTEFNDDITVVQVGWTVSINGTDYTVTYIDPSPPAHQYRITAAGATFVQNTTYTFSDPVPATHNWTISETGVLSTPGGGTISQQSDFIISVSGTDRIDLRTENGDAILDAEGNLNLTGNLVFSGGAIIDPTDNNFEVRGVQNVNFEANATVNIYTDSGNNAFQWQFGDDGNLTLPGNTFAVNYANGTAVPLGGGGNVSELVNGNNSFVLDSAGNVVFEGLTPGEGVDRGLVWDYGANANGVNSMIRQDLNGLTVRAWTEDSGNYTAPVNIITGQDASTNTWRFDGQGNLTVPSGSINSIDSVGDLGAYITLNPDLGLATLAGRNALSNVGYTNTAWSTATYTGTQIDFTNAPDLVTFFNDNQFNVGVNQTISINGDEPVPFTGYSTGSSNAVTVYTSATASPDPTTVTSIDFYYQLESYVSVDYDAGTLNINATGLTINLDNDQTSGPDINLRSGDDITLQGKDKSLGSESEGGDINIYGGDGGDDDGLGNNSASGGDIQIEGGIGGSGNTGSGSSGGFARFIGGAGGDAGVGTVAGSGGYVQINAGDGGYNGGNAQLGSQGGYVEIYAGQTTLADGVGGYVEISSGTAAEGNGIAGNVIIRTPISATGQGGNWTYDGQGNLTLPNGNPYIKTSDETSTINIKVSGSANNRSQFSIGSDGGTDQFTYISSQNDTNGFASFGLNAYSGVPTTAVIGINNGTALDWTFTSAALDDTEAYLYMPAGTTVTTPNAPSGQTGKNIFIEAGSVDQENYNTNTGGELFIKGGRGGFNDGGGGGPGGNVNINAGESADPAGHAGNVYVTAGALTNWTFDYTGNLTLPANTFSVNYANGTPVTFGSAALGNVTFSNVTVQGDNNSLNLSAGPDFTANLAYLQVRAGDVASHIHFDTGNNEAYDLIVGNDQKFVQVSSTGNILMSSYDGAFSYEMNLDNTGNLTIPGNLIAATASPAPRISGFDSVSALAFTNGTSNVTINANLNLWNFDSTGNLIIPGTSGGMIKTVANGAIGITAINNGSDNPAQMMSWTVGETNPDTIISTYSSNALIQSNVNGTLNTWKFDDAGNLTLPANTFAINYANGTQVSLGGSSISNGNSNVTIATSAGNVVTNVTGQTILTVYTGGIKVGGSGIIQSPGGAQAIVLNNNGANLPIANITNTLNVTGAAGANITSNLVVGGTVTATGKIGYSVGGAVTQTALGQSVTINQLTGKITMASKSWNTGDLEVFLVNCNKVTTDDFILVQPTGSTQSIYFDVVAYSPVANQFYVYVRSNEIVTEAVTVQFFIMKAPIA